jgi:DNA-directed RNA polymerase I, II, and III subunit RPABC1
MDDIKQLYTAWKTTIEMMLDRGYIFETPYDEIGYDEFRILYMDRNCDIYATDNTLEPGRKMYVKFVLNTKTKTSQVKEFIDEITEKYIDATSDELLIVMRGSYNTNIMKIQKDKVYKYVQIMWVKNLLFNPTRHSLVPKHEKITKDEISELMEKYQLKSRTQLPLITREDPIVRWYNFKSGDVLRIIRPSETSRESIFYRCVK